MTITSKDSAGIPVLDLSNWLAGGDPRNLVRELFNACTGIGFFYVAGHGISRDVVDGVFSKTKEYFDLPEDLRMQDRVDERFRRGYVPYGMNRHQGFDPDLKESFDFALDLPLTDPDVAAGRPLHGPNRWPVHLPTLQPAAERFYAEVSELGCRLLRLFALSLGAEEDFFLQWFKKPMVQTRLFHYPPQMMDESKALGVAPHTDYGMLTLLVQDPIGGLELQTRDGEWLAAPFIEDTFVVNIGDMFKVWSNDLFVSNMHRVVNRTGKERYSIPTFFNPDFDTPVACLPQCRSDENPAKYPPIAAGEYLVKRFREVQGYKG